jgi:polyphosphate:AMP phosphotransferase
VQEPEVFEFAELGSQVSKQELEEQLPALRVDLVNLQTDLRTAEFRTIVLVCGDDATGISDLVHTLHEWMDARFLPAFTFDHPSDEESERPPAWRYWRQMPANGAAHLFIGAWPEQALRERLAGDLDDSTWQRRTDRLNRFEQVLVDGDLLLLKIWLHLPEEAHRKRPKRARKDPKEAALLDRRDLERGAGKHHARFIEAARSLLTRTNTPAAPWQVIESTNARHRDLSAARLLRSALSSRLHSTTSAPAFEPDGSNETPTEIAHIDAATSSDPDDYPQRLDALQLELRQLTHRAREKRRSTVLVFEGWDAAGKGGVIRRITAAMDVRDYRLVPIGAPTDEEKAHHYLWRFWRQLPRAGSVLIFDRSWYGRVLVERVEGFASEADWRRGYSEIVQFEEQLAEQGMPILKFWLHIDADEQLRRFREREQTPYKKYKITAEDYRNRDQWEAYEAAVDEMVARTSSDFAPWHVVPANSKRFARIAVLDRICTTLRETL